VAPFLGVVVAVAAIDARHRIIPNRVTYPALVVASAVIVAAALAGGRVSVTGAALGVLAFGGGLFLVALIAPHGMGMGDVKLAALIGLVLGSLGLRYVAVAAIAGVLAGGLGGVGALLLGRSRKEAIPFGPYLAGGAVLATFAAPQVSAWYAGLLGA
jgi:leader peptidase (prepilin peptidase)/N-methyltransferase